MSTAPAFFVPRSARVSAVQWTGKRKSTEFVLAWVGTQGGTIYAGEGTLSLRFDDDLGLFTTVMPGDWIVNEGHGRFNAYDPTQFALLFQEAA